jgi:hypothetical protein
MAFAGELARITGGWLQHRRLHKTNDSPCLSATSDPAVLSAQTGGA